MAKKKEEKRYLVSWNQRIDGVVTHFEFVCTKKTTEKGDRYYENGKALICPPSTATIVEL